MIVSILESMNYNPTTVGVIKAICDEPGILEKLNQVIEWDKVEHVYKDSDTDNDKKKVTDKLAPGVCIKFKGNIIGVYKDESLHLITTPSGPGFLGRFIDEYVMPEYTTLTKERPYDAVWEEVSESLVGEGTSFSGLFPYRNFSRLHALLCRRFDNKLPYIKVRVVQSLDTMPVEMVLCEKGMYYDSDIFDETYEDYFMDLIPLAVQCCILNPPKKNQKESGN